MRRVLCLLLILASPLAAAEPHHSHAMAPAAHGRPLEAGQSAFAAVQEIVELLLADPATDWSRVDLERLRRHLIDMDNVTLRAEVASEAVDGGLRFLVTGDGAVRASIRRMVRAHAQTMSGYNGWRLSAAEHPRGAMLTALVDDEADLPMLRGLGFIGVMAAGAHHTRHHLKLATGRAPHHH